MKLYWSQGACSIGIHLLLEEIGSPYTDQRIMLPNGEQFTPEFKAVNPKSKVPTLELDDGTVLTEYPAIAFYLARKFPEANLWPHDLAAQARVLEAMDFVVATVHMRGFARLFRSSAFLPADLATDEARLEQTRAAGRQMVDDGFAILDAQLAGKEWVAGSYSIADSAVFYVCFWAAKRMNLALPANLAAHFGRMLARPATGRMLVAEGLA